MVIRIGCAVLGRLWEDVGGKNTELHLKRTDSVSPFCNVVTIVDCVYDSWSYILYMRIAYEVSNVLIIHEVYYTCIHIYIYTSLSHTHTHPTL